jgi:hypothetical protein
VVPDASWTKQQIVAWLKDHGVKTDQNHTKAELLDVVNDVLNPGT